MSAKKCDATYSIRHGKSTTRAGFLSGLCVFSQDSDPQDQPRWIKWTITWIAALAAATAPIGSAIILPALKEISESLDTSPVIVNLAVAFYMLSMGILALWWSSLSEILGRRAVYLGSFASLIVWNVLAAESSSIQMLIATRVVSGASAAAVTAVGAGTVADVWEPKHRGRAMGIFYLGPILGPLLGPLVGGALTDSLGWRSTQWFQAISAGFLLLLLLFCLPETCSCGTSGTDDTNQISLECVRKVTVRVFFGGFRTLALLRFPVVALAVYYASMGFGALMFFNISIETTFSHAPYNFPPNLVGCLYIFNSLGYLLASLLGGPWVDRIMHRTASNAGRYADSTQTQGDSEHQSRQLIYLPEDRLGENVWLSALLIPATLLWYGWCAAFHVHWAVTMMSGFVFGGASMLLFTTVLTMLTELMPSEASSGAALNNFLRNVFACVAAVAAEPGIDAIGNGWLFTVIALIALVSALCAVALKLWGESGRKQLEARNL